jgi:hypothetical protein
VLTKRVIIGTLVGLALLLAPTVPAQAAGDFTDVPPEHPYYGPIAEFASSGWIDGYGDGTFQPDEPVTRQQFAKMVVRTLRLTVTGNEVCPFTDVPKAPAGASDPFYPDKYVTVCYEQGWIEPMTATTFGPTIHVSRADLVAFAARARDLPDPPAGYDPPFGNFSAGYYVLASRAAYAGLLAGLQGMGPNFDFFQNASRGECAQVLHNILQIPRPTTTSTSLTPSVTGQTGQTTMTTSAQPSPSTEPSLGEGSAGPERTSSAAYLVVGLCAVVLVALVVILLTRRAPYGLWRRRAAPNPTGRATAETDLQEELQVFLGDWPEAQEPLLVAPAANEESDGADVWGELALPPPETERGDFLSVWEPESTGTKPKKRVVRPPNADGDSAVAPDSERNPSSAGN